MEHDVAALLAGLIARLATAHPVPGTAGAWIVPLAERSPTGGWAPAEFHQEDGAAAAEQTPPRPGRVVIVNRSHRDVAVYAGVVLRGGLADRAVVRSVLVPARSGRVATVEPIEPRWWPSGRLAPDGSVDPLRAALLDLADRRGVPAARARTAIWSLPGRSEEAAAPAGGPAGWIAVLDRRVVAASLHAPRRSRPAPPPDRGTDPVAVGSSAVVDLATAFLHDLLTEAGWAGTGPGPVEGTLRDSALRLTPLGGSAAHLTAVRLSGELITAAVLAHPDRVPALPESAQAGG